MSRLTAGIVVLTLLAAAGGAALQPTGAGQGVSFTRTLDLNTATAEELELLPGVGASLAQRIVEDRRTNGPYATLQDLDRVSGVGPAMLDRLAPYVTP